ncbi:MAG: TonB-dependent receptor [bacterium]
MHRFIGAITLACVAVIQVAGAQQRVPASADSVQRQDSLRRVPAVLLAPVEIRASIAPTAGTTVGSGIPARISTVAGAAVEVWHPRMLPDVLGSQPGVSLYDDLGTPWKLNLSTRGFSVGPTVGLPPGISVFVDGIRQNEPDAQEVNFDLLPLEHIQRIELLSGSASLLGPNSLGGAINLITKRGEGPLAGELEASAGSYGAFAGRGAVMGRASNDWDYYLGGGAERERGWREATSAANRNVFADIGHGSDERGVRLQASAGSSRAETAGSLPASVFGTSPRTNFTPGDFERLNAQQISASMYSPVGPGSGSLTIYFRRSAAERFNVNQAPDPNVRSFTNNYTVGGTADWRWATAAGSGALAFRAGIDGAANRVHVRILNEAQLAGSVSGESEAGDTLTTDIKSPSWDVAGYALIDYHIGRVTFSGGARDDYVRVPFRNLIDRTDVTENSYHHASPRGGATVDVGGGASLYASAGTSFRAPAILELGCADPSAACPLPFALGDDPPLKPVKATTYEIGARWAAGSVSINGSLYRTDVRDEIYFIASEQALLSGYFTNIDRTRREGAELAIDGRAVADRVDWHANYAFTRATFQSVVQLFSIRSDDDFAANALAGPNAVSVGSHLPLVPEDQVKAGASVRITPTLSAGADARYIGAQWPRGDEANETGTLDGYALVNANLNIAARGWEIGGIVTNLFDTRRANFGTFNENRRTGDLERFLSPVNARGFRIVLRRGFGGGH